MLVMPTNTENLYSEKAIFRKELNGVFNAQLFLLSELFDRCFDKINSIGYRNDLFLYIITEELCLFFDANVVRIDGAKGKTYDENPLVKLFGAPDTNIPDVTSGKYLTDEYSVLVEKFQPQKLIDECINEKHCKNSHLNVGLTYEYNNNINGIDAVYVCQIKDHVKDTILGTVEIYGKTSNAIFKQNCDKFLGEKGEGHNGFDLFLKHIFDFAIKGSVHGIHKEESTAIFPLLNESKKTFFEKNRTVKTAALFLERHEKLFAPLNALFSTVHSQVEKFTNQAVDDPLFTFTFVIGDMEEESASFFLTSAQIADLLKHRDDVFKFDIKEIRHLLEYQYKEGIALIGYIMRTNHSSYFEKYDEEPMQKRLNTVSGSPEVSEQVRLVQKMFRVGEEETNKARNFAYFVPLCFAVDKNKRRRMMALLVVTSIGQIPKSIRQRYFDFAWQVAPAVLSSMHIQTITEASVKGELKLLSSLGGYAQLLAHETRAPLNSIETTINDLLEANVLTDPVVKQDLLSSLSEIESVREIADKIRFCAIRDSHLQVKLIDDDFDLIDAVKELLSLYSHDKKLQEFKVIKDFKINHVQLYADKLVLQHIMKNLFRNAIEAVRKKYKNGDMSSGKIIVSIENYIGGVQISFQDNGVGITEPNQEMIFNPFFTTKDTRKLGDDDGESGMGLGLVSSLFLIEQYGGKIMFESKEDEGSKFTIFFPT